MSPTRKSLKLKVSLVAFGVLLLILVAACGGSPEPSPSDQSDGNPSNQPPASAPNTSSSNQPSSSSQLISEEACDAFAGIGGFGGLGGIPGGFANIVSSAQGGPSVQANYSSSPSSDEAEEIADFFEDALEDALGGDVSAECYWEISATEGGDTNRVIWVSLRLPSKPTSENIQQIQNSLTSMGATVGSFFGAPSGGETSAMIFVSELPLDLAGQTGGMLIISEEFAILMAGQDMESDTSQPSEPSPTPQSSASSSQTSPSPTPRPTPVQLESGASQNINETLENELEDVLGISLEVQGTFQGSTPQGTSLVTTFEIQEGDSVPSDVADKLEDIVKSFDANVTAKIDIQGAAIVNFEGMKIGGASAMGTIALAQDQKNIVVTLILQ